MRPTRRLRLLAYVTVFAGVLVGCGRVVDGAAVMQPLAGEDDCAKVSAPLSTILPQHDGEPMLRLPQPAGWERLTAMDSEVVRYMTRNPSLRASAAVTQEDVTKSNASPEDIIAAEFSNATTFVGATDVVTSPHPPVCGYPAGTVTFNVPQRGGIPPLSGLALAVITTGARKYAVVVTVQTAEPDNPTYVEDSKAIVDGFQVLRS
jgi:hypothetical protein